MYQSLLILSDRLHWLRLEDVFSVIFLSKGFSRRLRYVFAAWTCRGRLFTKDIRVFSNSIVTHSEQSDSDSKRCSKCNKHLSVSHESNWFACIIEATVGMVHFSDFIFYTGISCVKFLSRACVEFRKNTSLKLPYWFVSCP